MTRTENSRRIKREIISSPKSALISVLRRLESDGLKRDANALGNIIARLEDFQNRA
jgi:hypothetical protein